MDVDMPSIKNKILHWNGFVYDLPILLFAHFCNIDCCIYPGFLFAISHEDLVRFILEFVKTDEFYWRFASDDLNLMVDLSPFRRVNAHLFFHFIDNFISLSDP